MSPQLPAVPANLYLKEERNVQEKNPGLWPRCEIALENGTVVVVFNLRTLAKIERESGMSAMEFGKKFSDMNTAPIFDMGMRVILGAVKSVLPDMTEDLLAERIPPAGFQKILTDVSSCWAASVSLAFAGIAKVDTADPSVVGSVLPSPT